MVPEAHHRDKYLQVKYCINEEKLSIKWASWQGVRYALFPCFTFVLAASLWTVSSSELNFSYISFAVKDNLNHLFAFENGLNKFHVSSTFRNGLGCLIFQIRLIQILGIIQHINERIVLLPVWIDINLDKPINSHKLDHSISVHGEPQEEKPNRAQNKPLDNI